MISVTMTNVVFNTSMGKITIKLYSDMPKTTGNFIKLAKKGFYDNLIFHRVINNFMVQGGCPKGDGTGGPGYTIEDEFGSGHSNVRGTIAMANTGRPNSGGCQFFINTVDNPHLNKENKSTPYAHPVFGEVVEGMDIIDAINKVKTGRNDKPAQDIVIQKVEVLD